MNTNYDDLAKVRQIWIFPYGKGKSGTFRTHLTGEAEGLDPETVQEMQNVVRGLEETLFIIVGSDYNDPDMEIEVVKTVAEAFRNRDRERAIQYLAQKGLHMTKEIVEDLRNADAWMPYMTGPEAQAHDAEVRAQAQKEARAEARAEVRAEFEDKIKAKDRQIEELKKLLQQYQS